MEKEQNDNSVSYDVFKFEFLDQDYDYILCLKFAPPSDVFNPDMNELTKSLEKVIDNDPKTFIILTQKKQAPLYLVSNDELIYSFSCNFQCFKKMIRQDYLINIHADYLLFDILEHIGRGKSFLDKVIVRQIPFEIETLTNGCVCDVIIPHKGNDTYLRNLMRFLKNISSIKVFVGIDQPTTGKNFKCSDSTKASFYSFNPNPLGPYVIRNWLADQGKSEIIAFQDSDDMPCADRFQRLSDHMIKQQAPLCGSHEIKMDYFNRTIQAIRYPLNVNIALEKGPAHALLHPSSAILRKTFYFCNKCVRK